MLINYKKHNQSLFVQIERVFFILLSFNIFMLLQVNEKIIIFLDQSCEKKHFTRKVYFLLH